jgi:transcriptional regulator
MEHRPKLPTNLPFMTAPERDAKILALRKRGWTYKKIGQAVDMTSNGIMQALRRMADTQDPRHPRVGRDPRA